MGCDNFFPKISVSGGISIHASRMGCDQGYARWNRIPRHISIHASRMGCDLQRQKGVFFFQCYFNPRIPYGMRRSCGRSFVTTTYFNPRIPYGMRRSRGRFGRSRRQNFNPRIPYGMRLYGLFIAPNVVFNFNPRIPYGMRRRAVGLRYGVERFQHEIGMWITQACG